ncbi:hypothetical protein BT63DRAFT_428214 [Microthyrium microscopicum]|uniref:Uncharacterized protein n=1 Tax=Microthyrium microscopicum TaxID=703497 RepID=A0A6A6U2D3_9PEZI|nr:hypothetical protein BT63DRAFT_428214 [Microthyrium microscopicum]
MLLEFPFGTSRSSEVAGSIPDFSFLELFEIFNLDSFAVFKLQMDCFRFFYLVFSGVVLEILSIRFYIR